MYVDVPTGEAATALYGASHRKGKSYYTLSAERSGEAKVIGVNDTPPAVRKGHVRLWRGGSKGEVASRVKGAKR